jgi:glutathione S-transferase
MLPNDLHQRARVRMIEDTADQYLNAALRDLRQARFEYAPPYLIPKKPDQVDEKLLQSSRSKVHAHLALLEAELQGRTWFGGEVFSLADASLAAPLTASLPLQGVLPDSRYPNIEAWTRRIRERPAYIASAPKQPLTIKQG